MTRRRKYGSGYTIVEVMIFLAVSTTLFISATVLITGQQRKTEFTQGVRDLDTRLADISNDLATGVYTNTNNFQCSAAGGTLTITGGTNQQGANSGCIYLGKVIQFSPDESGNNTYRIYTVVGKQFNGSSIPNSIAQATPQAIAPGTATIPPNLSGVPDATETFHIEGGSTIAWARAKHNGVYTDISSVAILANFDPLAAGVGQAESTSLKANTYTLGNGLNKTMPETADDVAKNVPAWSATENPNGGVFICLNRADDSQHAILTIGGANRQQYVSTIIGGGNCSSVTLP